MDPMVDTIEKINSLNLSPGASVLDTCMGLGYTAIEAGKRVTPGGAVTTIEFDDASVDMCRHNPWSQHLFDSTLPITILRGDGCAVVQTFADASFDAIIHDPPALALCKTDLYGLAFYRQLRRVLKEGGRLYHYIGTSISIAIHCPYISSDSVQAIPPAGRVVCCSRELWIDCRRLDSKCRMIMCAHLVWWRMSRRLVER